LTTIVSSPFEENTYVASLDGRSECLIVDAGLEPRKILDHLDERRLHPAAILCTHGHPDHIGGNAALKARWPDCPLVCGRDEAPGLTRAAMGIALGLGLRIENPPADVIVSDGDTYSAAGFQLKVRHLPGHSPDHVVFIWSAASPAYVFCGDVLFQGGIGRTDFPGGSFEKLRAGICEKLFSLPDDTIVLSGHGEPTTIGAEKRWNPFVGARAARDE
jgi:glyoxylase-like metal-dependent hydrolase (beta-lactamase superfamily II)